MACSSEKFTFTFYIRDYCIGIMYSVCLTLPKNAYISPKRVAGCRIAYGLLVLLCAHVCISAYCFYRILLLFLN
jgi:hypothetical protein